MTTKILPLSNPPVRCFLYEAYPLSIQAVHEEYLPWFYSNYIQVCCYKDFIERNEVFLEFFGPDQAFQSPWLKFQYFSWDSISNSGIDIVNFIISQIDKNYYFYCYIDEYYIPFVTAYNTVHITHDIFIYGYDSEKRIFNVSGYDKNKNFTKNKVGFDDFKLAFINNNWDKDKYYWTDRIYLFSYNTNASYKFDLVLMSELLDDYINSRDTSERYRRYSNPLRNKIFGFKTYECIKKYLELLIDEKMSIDLRIPYLLWEHKKCMLFRIKYLIDEIGINSLSYFYDMYLEIEKNANTTIMLMIKYQITNKSTLIEKILLLINEIEKKEREILPELLRIIQQNLYLTKI